MKICELSIKNFRSIVDSGRIPIKDMFALVGENNAGKSNILKSIQVLLTGGIAGIKLEDFYDQAVPIVIKAKFYDLNKAERKRWKKYLVGEYLILEKRIWVEEEPASSSKKLKTEYHGYEAEPVDWFLSIKNIIEREGQRPNWIDIVKNNGLPDYFIQDGKCNKTIYTKALERYLSENDVEYQAPDLSQTQALGLQSNVIASLPSFYLLPAITDYSDEIDKRQKSSTFRRLMAELSERILKNDSRYSEIENSLNKVNALLNAIEDQGNGKRLEALETIEQQIFEQLKRLMPSVKDVTLSIQLSDIKELFSGGVFLSVNDGVETDVLAKGHGLQRCIVFSLLRTLIDTEKNVPDKEESKSIILAIEEPELYIHPQLSRLFYDALYEFSKTDQVIYATHSPIFIDAYEYEKIGIVSKENIEVGTKIKTADGGQFNELDDRKIFKGLSRFNPAVSELFFAKKVLLVEGPEDLIAINTVLKNEGVIRYRTEEIDWTVIVAGGKEAIPFLQRIMNEFGIKYAVLHDLDITKEMSDDVKNNHLKVNKIIASLAEDMPVYTFPIKLEKSLNIDYHLKDQYKAHQFFNNSSNITQEVKDIILKIFN